jgi:tetratricopeptide (TPR) repeat protein
MKSKRSKQAAAAHPKSGGDIIKTGSGHWLPLVALTLLCLIVYYNSLSNGFVYDDYGVIVENRYIKQPGKFVTSLFNQSYYKMAGLEASYRPVASFSYLLVYSLAGLKSFYFHLASLLLHILNTLLVYCLANIILQNRLRAALAACLFACHPVLSEAVNCISFNDDLLTTLFFLLALLVYIRIKAEQVKFNIGAYCLSLLWYLFGLLSKEMAITLPAIIVLYDLILRDPERNPLRFRHLLNILKNRASFYAGYAAVSLFYLFLRFYLFQIPGESLKSSYGGLFERIIYLPGHIFSFIRLILFPTNLTADYVFAYPESFFNVVNLVGFAVVMGLAGTSYFIYRYSKEIFFGLWWCFITLFPVSNIIEIFHPLAERYLYLPLIGFCLVVPVIIFGLAGRLITRTPAANLVSSILILGIISIYSTATLARNPDWQSNYSLWSKTVQTSPNSLVAHGGLGMAYLERGMLDKAHEQFETAIKLYPDHHKGYYNLGLIYHRKGDLKRAMEYFQRAVTLNPESIKGHYNLATLYAQQGLLDLAIRHYTKVIELDPDVVEAHYNLGMAYAMQRKLQYAISEWEKVLQLEPRHTAARNNLAKAKRMMDSAGRPKNN